MALPSSGEIAFSMINEQLRRPTTQSYNLNDAQGRALAGVTSGAISMSNFHGKWAGSRMVSGYRSGNNSYGFKQGVMGSLAGGYGMVDLQEIAWYAGGANIIHLQTVVGADKPNSRLLRVTDDNFNLVATYNLPEWSAVSNTWITLMDAPVNPFPNGQIRWFTW